MKKRFVRKKKAFTIIEFMLAMTFLAVMLMGITTITMRILEIYRKGLTMREINANGRDILNDLTRTVGGSPIVEHINPEASNGMNITPDDIKVAYRNYFNETMMTSNGKSVQAGGVLVHTPMFGTRPQQSRVFAKIAPTKTDYFSLTTITINSPDSLTLIVLPARIMAESLIALRLPASKTIAL